MAKDLVGLTEMLAVAVAVAVTVAVRITTE